MCMIKERDQKKDEEKNTLKTASAVVLILKTQKYKTRYVGLPQIKFCHVW